MTIAVFTIGGGDLIEAVFNAVASVFNNAKGIASITSLAVMFGGIFSVFEFSKSRDITRLMKWAGLYVMVTSLVLYPKTTITIEDRTGFDRKPRIVDHVPLSLALFASVTSRIGIGMTEMIETVFHMPNDMEYNKTGMLMGSKLVLAAQHFQINDPEFSETLNQFMKQCVFFDLLLQRYTVQDLMHANNPWVFIKENTSKARAFPLNGTITVCKAGAAQLDALWKNTINQAASLYGGQLFGNYKNSASLLLSHLSNGYDFLTNVSVDGKDVLQTHLLANAIDQALAHYGASVNAPAALQVYTDTKTELQTRETLDQTGRQAGIWLQQLKNIIEAVLYSAFIFIYFLSYFPFGASIMRNYLFGLFFLQTLSPLYAIINFAANFYAQNRSLAFLASDTTQHGLSMANVSGIVQANADAMALAGYLIWPLTLGGAMMLFRGLPSAVQSIGQMLGGVAQHAGGHVVGEAVGGNISAGNLTMGNRSLFNTSANHWDTNARYSAGSATFQTDTGSTVTMTSGGNEILNNSGALSNLGISAQMGSSIRTALSHQAQTSMNAAINKTQAAGEQYSAGLRQLADFSTQQGHAISSGDAYNHSETSGTGHAAQKVSQLMSSWEKNNNVSHERALQLFGQVYADYKLGRGGLSGGISGNLSGSMRYAYGESYANAKRYAEDNHFSDTVDSAVREAKESQYRDTQEAGSRLATSIASSFDHGDHFRTEAASQFSKAESYTASASSSEENSASINANYVQAFYEWLHHQPSPGARYGNGNMSRSAIDNMATHDPDSLQQYANRFIQEKMRDNYAQFEQNNHLNDKGASIENSYTHHNHNMHQPAQVEEKFHRFNNDVEKHLHETEPKGIGIINQQTKKDIEALMKKDKTEIAYRQDNIHTQGQQTHQQEVDAKVKDKVLGNVGKDIKSFIENIKN